jgi:hypothetical protein
LFAFSSFRVFGSILRIPTTEECLHYEKKSRLTIFAFRNLASAPEPNPRRVRGERSAHLLCAELQGLQLLVSVLKFSGFRQISTT